jgi:UDP-N-acetylmuramate dehydrogenase
VQNIGAYGVEAKDYILKVDTVNLQHGTRLIFTNTDCNFAYRNSIFKNKLKDKYLISYVYFRLLKKPKFLLEYGNIKDELKKTDELSLKTIRRAIINIREAKLPDPKKMPNAGSFFKNPVVSQKKFTGLLKKFPKIVNYPLNEKQVKLAAGWLIDNTGLKGFVLGKVGVHKHQALVLVNHNNANGNDILALAEHIKQTVFAKFSVTLHFEVIIY